MSYLISKRQEGRDLNSKVVRGRVKMSQQQFEVRLASIKAQQAIAFESAKSMDAYGTDATLDAKQRRMNMMVELMILQLEEESGIHIAVRREESVNRCPFPPEINQIQTMLNWVNRR